MTETQARSETRTPAPRAGVALAVGIVFALGFPSPAPAANVFIQVLTPAVTLVPTAADYEQDFIDAAGASGIALRIKTNDPVGMAILVRCSDPAPQIAPGDLMVRTLTPPGNGGRALDTYTPVTAVNQLLWSTGTSIAPFFNVTTDIRIRNLFNYDDGPAAGPTGYTSTLTFSVIAQ